jgi:hypothetical protein
LFADECAALFGGIDILGLDFVHEKVTGKNYIIELNDTAIGLVHVHEQEDMSYMKVVLLLCFWFLTVFVAGRGRGQDESAAQASIVCRRLGEERWSDGGRTARTAPALNNRKETAYREASQQVKQTRPNE